MFCRFRDDKCTNHKNNLNLKILPWFVAFFSQWKALHFEGFYSALSKWANDQKAEKAADKGANFYFDSKLNQINYYS